MDQSKKLKEIAALQNFGIFLVVLGHSYPIFHYSMPADWIYQFIYSFHMPLFMSISGFLFIYTGGTKQNYIRFLVHKFHRLLIPYFALSSVAFIPKTYLSDYAVRPAELTLERFLKSFVYPDDNAISFFWFLPVLFLIFVISPLLNKALQNFFTALFVTVALLSLNIYNPAADVLFLKPANICTYLLYFWIGCTIGHFKLFYQKLFTNIFIRYASVAFLLALSSFYTTSSLLTLIASLTGIVMSFSLAKVYTEKKLRFFDFIDGYSYQIYLLSWFPQVFVKVFIYQILGFPFYASAFLMVCGGLVIPIFLTIRVRKHSPSLLPLIGLKNKEGLKIKINKAG